MITFSQGGTAKIKSRQFSEFGSRTRSKAGARNERGASFVCMCALASVIGPKCVPIIPAVVPEEL